MKKYNVEERHLRNNLTFNDLQDLEIGLPGISWKNFSFTNPLMRSLGLTASAPGVQTKGLEWSTLPRLTRLSRVA